MLVSAQGVLLARRPLTKTIAPGKYHIPGGHIEFGEDPETALVREFQEEFSLTVKPEEIVRSFAYQSDDTHSVGLTFVVTAVHIPTPITFDPNENDELVWVTADTWQTYISDSEDHDYKTLEKYFLMK